MRERKTRGETFKQFGREKGMVDVQRYERQCSSSSKRVRGIRVEKKGQ